MNSDKIIGCFIRTWPFYIDQAMLTLIRLNEFDILAFAPMNFYSLPNSHNANYIIAGDRIAAFGITIKEIVATPLNKDAGLFSRFFDVRSAGRCRRLPFLFFNIS